MARVAGGALLLFAVYPNVVLAPGASDPLYGSLAAVRFEPEPPRTAFHRLVIDAPDGCDQPAVHEDVAEEPVFFTVTVA